MGASRLLVRFTVRINACSRSFPEDEMMSWDVFWGSEERLLFMRVPWAGGDALRFDMATRLESVQDVGRVLKSGRVQIPT